MILAAPPPRVETMVVGPSAVLFAARTVTARATRVRVAGASCRVPPASGLAVLAAARRAGGPAFGVTVSCDTPYVRKVGRFAARGADGWYYKVGRTAPKIGAGAALRSIRPGARVLWFWCRFKGKSCQRTLAVHADRRRATRGAPLTVTVRGYDDRGRGVPVAGATVRLGPARGRTGARGRVVLTAPESAGTLLLRAERPGLVPAFPARVTVR